MVTIRTEGEKEVKLFSTFQASVYLGCSPITLNNWRRLGFFNPYRIGSGYYFMQKDLDLGVKLLNNKNILVNKLNEDRENINVRYV